MLASNKLSLPWASYPTMSFFYLPNWSAASAIQRSSLSCTVAMMATTDCAHKSISLSCLLSRTSQSMPNFNGLLHRLQVQDEMMRKDRSSCGRKGDSISNFHANDVSSYFHRLGEPIKWPTTVQEFHVENSFWGSSLAKPRRRSSIVYIIHSKNGSSSLFSIKASNVTSRHGRRSPVMIPEEPRSSRAKADKTAENEG
ncbi:hypothetical protein BJV78DRAFT_1194229 [Lactifluus subvellereus]|nr:hypothetical protein BJV78DRAFT_1194229 [Lactifluus subvellereus]